MAKKKAKQPKQPRCITVGDQAESMKLMAMSGVAPPKPTIITGDSEIASLETIIWKG